MLLTLLTSVPLIVHLILNVLSVDFAGPVIQASLIGLIVAYQ